MYTVTRYLLNQWYHTHAHFSPARITFDTTFPFVKLTPYWSSKKYTLCFLVTGKFRGTFTDNTARISMNGSIYSREHSKQYNIGCNVDTCRIYIYTIVMYNQNQKRKRV